MITTIHIKNIGIIDDLSIDFNQGLNILTGETGAGKTLIIDSLQIICGGRFSKDMIRKGQDYSFVEMNLYMPDSLEAIESNIIISREIHTNGRNSCKINGRLVTVNELKVFMENIVDIHGQYDNQSLLNSNMHLNYLDNFIGKNIEDIKEKYQELYAEEQKIISELKRNYGDDKEKQRKLDLLKYQLEEIHKANLKKNEEEELENTRNKILNAEKIIDNLEESDCQIRENAIDSINIAIRSFEKIENIDERYNNILNNLKSIYYDLQELSRDISSLKSEVNFDEEERSTIETRLDLIFSLKRKYGNNIEEILNYGEEIKNEIETIENLEEYNIELKNKQKEIESQMNKLANEMHETRKEYARKLEEYINMELKDLEMKQAIFKVKIEKTENFNNMGQDKIEFMIRTNVGEEEKQLNKIASGGEMSRIMLAIKTVLTEVDKVPVLVFDEIDTGISGKAAVAVGQKLTKIAISHQVLVVTHLAVIAAKADSHYYISKEVLEEKTKTKVKLLSEEETLREIARISSGEVTEISIEHAKQLKEKTYKY